MGLADGGDDIAAAEEGGQADVADKSWMRAVSIRLQWPLMEKGVRPFSASRSFTCHSRSKLWSGNTCSVQPLVAVSSM